jgi:hypothetical protein
MRRHPLDRPLQLIQIGLVLIMIGIVLKIVALLASAF